MNARLLKSAGSTGQTPPPGEAPPNLRAAFLPFVGQWRLIALAGLIPAALVFLWLSAKPAEYTAAAQVLINKTRLDLGNIPNLVEDGQAMREQIFTEVDVIRSQPVLESVARELRARAEAEPDQGPGLFGRMKQGLGSLFGGNAPPEDPAAAEAAEVAARVIALRQVLDVELRPESFIVDVRVTATDRHWATTVSNLVADAYLDHQRQTKVALADKTLAGINTEIASLEEDLTAAIAQLAEAQRRYSDEQRFTSDTVASDINRLSDQLAGVRSRIAEAEALGDSLRLAAQGPVTDIAPGTQLEEISVLRRRIDGLRKEIDARASRLGPEHPEMVALRDQIAGAERSLREVIDREIRQNAAAIETLKNSEARLRQFLAEARDAMLAAEVTDREVARYAEQAEALKKVYANVLERRSEIQTQRDLSAPDATLLAAASLPLEPSGPAVLPLTVVAGILGALGACAWIALSDLFRRDYRDLGELNAAQGLLPLGTLPRTRLDSAQPSEAWKLAARYVNIILEDSRRGRIAKEGRVCVVVSLSPLATSVNLARAFAQAATAFGLSAVVIDLEDAPRETAPDRAPARPAKAPTPDGREIATVATGRLDLARAPQTTTFAPVSATAPGIVGSYWYQTADDILLIVDAQDLDRDRIDACLSDLAAHRAKVRMLALRDEGRA